MGGERDRIVDEVGVKELATFLDTEHIMLPTVPHEVCCNASTNHAKHAVVMFSKYGVLFFCAQAQHLVITFEDSLVAYVSCFSRYISRSLLEFLWCEEHVG